MVNGEKRFHLSFFFFFLPNILSLPLKLFLSLILPRKKVCCFLLGQTHR